MQIKLSKTISKLVFSGLMIIPVIGFGASAGDFPFHIEETVNKEKVLPFDYKDVWEAAMTVMKELSGASVEKLRERGAKGIKATMESDAGSGVINLSITYKGKSGLFSSTVLPEFYYHMLFLRPLENGRTCVLSKHIKYISFDGYRFSGNWAPRLSFMSTENVTYGEILKKLKEQANEKKQ